MSTTRQRRVNQAATASNASFPLPREGPRAAIDRGRALAERVRINSKVWTLCCASAEDVAMWLEQGGIGPGDYSAFHHWSMPARYVILNEPAGLPFDPVFDGIG